MSQDISRDFLKQIIFAFHLSFFTFTIVISGCSNKNSNIENLGSVKLDDSVEFKLDSNINELEKSKVDTSILTFTDSISTDLLDTSDDLSVVVYISNPAHGEAEHNCYAPVGSKIIKPSKSSSKGKNDTIRKTNLCETLVSTQEVLNRYKFPDELSGEYFGGVPLFTSTKLNLYRPQLPCMVTLSIFPNGRAEMVNWSDLFHVIYSGSYSVKKQNESEIEINFNLTSNDYIYWWDIGQRETILPTRLNLLIKLNKKKFRGTCYTDENIEFSIKREKKFKKTKK